MTDSQIIDRIIHSFRNYNLRDIKQIALQDTFLAAFTLCCCFIEQASGFRYAKTKNFTGKAMFEHFVREYLNSYDPTKLRNDLRNKLVHNYSVGTSYSLTKGQPDKHLSRDSSGRKLLNLENFVSDIENAFERWANELRTSDSIKLNAITWYHRHRPLDIAE